MKPLITKRESMTMAEQTQSEPLEETAIENQEAPSPRKKKKKGFGVSWLAGPIILLTVAWVAPMIIANTDLRNPALTRLISGFDQKLNVKFASLDWMSPVVLHDVTISDKQNQPTVTISEIRTEHTLFALVFQGDNLGTIKLAAPVLKVKLRDGGSNVEDLLNPILAAQDPNGESAQLNLILENATVEVYDNAGTLVNTTSLQELRLERTAAETKLELTGTVNDAPLHLVGDFDATYQSGSLHWKTDQLDLVSWKALLSRWQPAARLGGRVTADQTCVWDRSTPFPSLALSGPLHVDQLEVLLPDQMGGDPLYLPELKTAGALQVSPQKLQFENATLDSALGHARLLGEMNLDEFLAQPNWQKKLATLLNSDLAIQGYVDLAELANLFPQALSIRKEMRIVAGQADLSLHTLDQNGQRVLQARLGTTDLLAEQNGKSVAWKEPLKIDCQLHLENDWPVVDRLRGSSEFMEFQGEGSLESARFQLTADLQKFSVQLAQFVDPGFETLQGRMNAQFQTRLQNGANWSADSRLVVENFNMSWPGSAPWQEQRLIVESSTQGLLVDRQLQRIDAAKLVLISGNDRLQTILTSPVELGHPPYTFATTLQGDLANWQNRLRPFTSLDPWQLRGDINLTSQSSLSSEHLRFVDTNLNINSFVAEKPGISIQEPKLRVQTVGEFDRNTGDLTVEDLTVASSSLGVRTVGLKVQPVANSTPEISGNLALKADLNRISGWFANHPLLQNFQLGGLAKFQLQFDRGSEIARTIGQLTLDQFSLTSLETSYPRNSNSSFGAPLASPVTSRKTLWAENTFQVTWKTARQSDLLDLEQLTVDSKLLKLHTYGKISELSTVRNVELSGNVEYDLENLMRVLQLSDDPAVQLTGHHKKSFVLSGPLGAWAANTPPPAINPDGSYGTNAAVQNVSLNSGNLKGQAAFAWDSARLYGLPVGPGELALQLDDKILRIEPVSLQVAEGRVNLSPHIRFDQASPTLHLDPSKVMENIKLTPELCADLLQYVAPMLSDVSQVEGHFSMDINSAQIPLMTPSSSDVTGVLQVERAEVRPGQMANQLTALVKQVKSIINRSTFTGNTGNSTWIVMPQQQSEFRMTGGRVYHKRLEFQIDDTVLYTTGSVGLDNSLNLVAEIPIQEKWLGNNRLLASMRGHVLRVPISGTLKQPIVDQQALAVFASQFAGSAAQNYLQNELDNQLQKLFSR
ncbi:MAG: hypothetical protein KDA65_08610 [Planctomycetaceae bacterium]|nr:hypothetical protein [Planctomycetaceae bacterium]